MKVVVGMGARTDGELRSSPGRPASILPGKTLLRGPSRLQFRGYVPARSTSRDGGEGAAQSKPSPSSVSDRCETGDPDFDLCAVPLNEMKQIDTLRDGAPSIDRRGTATDVLPADSSGAAEISISRSAVREAYERGKWLVGLLILQSSSSFVLDKYQDLIREHLVVTLFLTMLVGAGGNAGNQVRLEARSLLSRLLARKP